MEHIAFNVSRATFLQAPARLRDRGIDFIQRDRGFMDSIYLHDPNGLKIELACYKFETPEGYRDVDVLMRAHQLRVDPRPPHHRGAPRRCDRAVGGGAFRPRAARLRRRARELANPEPRTRDSVSNPELLLHVSRGARLEQCEASSTRDFCGFLSSEATNPSLSSSSSTLRSTRRR